MVARAWVRSCVFVCACLWIGGDSSWWDTPTTGARHVCTPLWEVIRWHPLWALRSVPSIFLWTLILLDFWVPDSFELSPNFFPIFFWLVMIGVGSCCWVEPTCFSFLFLNELPIFFGICELGSLPPDGDTHKAPQGEHSWAAALALECYSIVSRVCWLSLRHKVPEVLLDRISFLNNTHSIAKNSSLAHSAFLLMHPFFCLSCCVFTIYFSPLLAVSGVISFCHYQFSISLQHVPHIPYLCFFVADLCLPTDGEWPPPHIVWDVSDWYPQLVSRGFLHSFGRKRGITALSRRIFSSPPSYISHVYICTCMHICVLMCICIYSHYIDIGILGECSIPFVIHSELLGLSGCSWVWKPNLPPTPW